MQNSLVIPDLSFFILQPEYVSEHVENFIHITSGIPKENWVLENYLYELPGKWDYSIGVMDAREEKLVGFIIASDKGEAIHIHKYAVHPDYRSMGLGLKLLKYFEKRVKQKSAAGAISLYVDKTNEGAIKFYERNGFAWQHDADTMMFLVKRLQVIVAIHQPNFFPWLGFFHKIAQADKFIVLDHVTNNPSDSLYTKRVTIVANSQPFWLSVPLVKPRDRVFVPINEMEIADARHSLYKHLKTIDANYRKTPFYEEFLPVYQLFYNHDSPLIAERNLEVIKAVCQHLSLDTPFYISSACNRTEASNELLIQLIKLVGGNTYLHGSFAVSEQGYQDDNMYKEAGIDLLPQQFSHPEYTQHNNKGAFIKGTTIMDALMNVGAEKVKTYLNSQWI